MVLKKMKRAVSIWKMAALISIYIPSDITIFFFPDGVTSQHAPVPNTTQVSKTTLDLESGQNPCMVSVRPATELVGKTVCKSSLVIKVVD